MTSSRSFVQKMYFVGVWAAVVLSIAGWAQQPGDFIRHAPELAESLPLIQANDAHELGYTGKGVGVAVVDIYKPSAGDPCASSHGLWIEGLILGVAPDAKVKRFEVSTVPTNQGDRACYTMNSNDIRSALQALVNNHERWGIQIVNLSWGGGRHTRPCNGERDAISRQIQQLVAKGVTVVAASGNDGWHDAMIWPACMPETISVSASFDYDAQQLERTSRCAQTPSVDAITCYGNTAAFLDVVAPGSRASVSDNLTGLGTSASAAYVSGVAALMLQAKPTLSPEQVRHYLSDSGHVIKDTRNGLSFPRVNALSAVQASLPDSLDDPEPLVAQQGDLNQDGELNQQDVMLLLSALGDLITLSETQRALADVATPCDGDPNWDDYYRLKSMAAGDVETDCQNDGDIEPAAIQVTPLQINANVAHPVAGGMRFWLQGQGIVSGSVTVYDLTGRSLFQSDVAPGRAMYWYAQSATGRPLANGVYLVVWDVSGTNGQRQRSVQKVAWLR